jgi:hypothetical protein
MKLWEGRENCITRSFIICTLHSYSDQIKEDEMQGACSTNGEKRKAYRLLVGNPEGRKALGRPRRRWVNNIKMYFEEIGLGRRDIDWSSLAQDKEKWRSLVTTIMNLWVPQNAAKPSSGCKTGDLLSDAQLHREKT